MTTQPTVVWTEIPVSNLENAIAFYDDVFGYRTEIDRSNPSAAVVLNGSGDRVGASLFEGEAARGNVIHLAVPDTCEAAAKRLSAHGGTVLGDAVQIPPGRFIMALDPDGNQLGLFQPTAP